MYFYQSGERPKSCLPLLPFRVFIPVIMLRRRHRFTVFDQIVGLWMMLCVIACLLAIPVVLVLAIWKRDSKLLAIALPMLGVAAIAIFLIGIEEGD